LTIAAATRVVIEFSSPPFDKEFKNLPNFFLTVNFVV